MKPLDGVDSEKAILAISRDAIRLVGTLNKFLSAMSTHEVPVGGERSDKIYHAPSIKIINRDQVIRDYTALVDLIKGFLKSEGATLVKDISVQTKPTGEIQHKITYQ